MQIMVIKCNKIGMLHNILTNLDTILETKIIGI